MKIMKIKFDDGYTVTLTDTEISIQAGGKSTRKSDPLNLREVSGEMELKIKSRGSDPTSYLWDGCNFVVRRWNGVDEAVVEITTARRKKRDTKKAERDARFQSAREIRRATIREKTPAWNADLETLIEQIPTTALRVACTKTGHFDGYDNFSQTCDGETLRSQDVTFLGCVGFLGDGECGFIDRTERVAFIEMEKLESIRASRIARESAAKEAADKKNSDRAAKFTQARESGKPVVLESWCETRRAQEAGQWGDYTFACFSVAQPDGSVIESAVNTF